MLIWASAFIKLEKFLGKPKSYRFPLFSPLFGGKTIHVYVVLLWGVIYFRVTRDMFSIIKMSTF